MDFERDEMGKPKPGSRCWLPSLKYTFQAVPKPNEKPKALTNDQKQQNMVFTRECRKLWQEAQNDLRERVIDGVVRLERKKAEKRNGDNEEKEGSMKKKESNTKERQETESK
jgi:hypothetical protein